MVGTWNITKISKEKGKVVIEATSDAGVHGAAIIEEGEAWNLVKKVDPRLSSWHRLCNKEIPGGTSNLEDDLRALLSENKKKK